MRPSRAHIAIIGGGPGGYEAALVAAQLGAEVTLAERDGLGGACVLTDCVPSKTLIETSSTVSVLNGSADLGIRPWDGAGGGTGTGPGGGGPSAGGAPAGHRARPLVEPARLYGRIKALARAQSADVAARVAAEGVEVIDGNRPSDPGPTARVSGRCAGEVPPRGREAQRGVSAGSSPRASTS